MTTSITENRATSMGQEAGAEPRTIEELLASLPVRVDILGEVQVLSTQLLSPTAQDLLCLLTVHPSRDFRAAELVGLLSRPRMSDTKTIRNVMWQLRKACDVQNVGSRRIPKYRVTGFESDWARFQYLAKFADKTNAQLRDDGLEALGLVRGVPFVTKPPDTCRWATEEVAGKIAERVTALAARTASQLASASRYEDADMALVRGLRAAPKSPALWKKRLELAIGHRPTAYDEILHWALRAVDQRSLGDSGRWQRSSK